MAMTYERIARRIDHAVLGPTLTTAELEEGCRLALRYGVASVCIKPFAVRNAEAILRGSRVAVGTTIGFPHGGHATAVKRSEAERALDDGATEIDIVVNIGQVLGDEWGPVRDEVGTLTDVAHGRGGLIKVIFENCYLSPAQIGRLGALCGEVGADYVKTSTGYGSGGASADDLILMRETTPDRVRLKASGGIRTLDQVIGFIDLGCDRIGLSRTAEVLDAFLARERGEERPSGDVSRETDTY